MPTTTNPVGQPVSLPAVTAASLDPLAAYAAAAGDRPALVEGGRKTSFAELNDAVNRIANALAARGARPGERAVWCGLNQGRILAFMHACRKLGLVAIPMPYRLVEPEMRHVLSDSAATIVVVDARLADVVTRAAAGLGTVRELVVLEHPDSPEALVLPGVRGGWDELSAASSPEEPPTPQGDQLGTAMMYTSGTTGRPKGAVRSRTDRELLGSMLATLGFGDSEVHLTSGPLYHAGPNAFALLANLTGGAVVVLERFDAAEWLRLVTDHEVTSTFATPTHMKRVLSLDETLLSAADLSSMRTLIVNAAPVPYSLKQEIIARMGDGFLYEVYGSTELGIDTILEPADQLRKPGSCGRPYGGIEVKVTDGDGREVAVGEVGELFVRTNLAIDGYRGDQQLATLPGGWHSVGDLAHLDDEGFVYICDRRDDLIITGGANVYPAEVEAVIHSHPSVADVAVFAVPDDEFGSRVHAVVQPWPGRPVDVDGVEDLCRTQLAGYKVPRSWEVRDHLPRTESGKLLKRELRAENHSRRASREAR